ncbi:MAG: hypothetical protein EOO24_10595, partial [Comamonadaceae bacterium]
ANGSYTYTLDNNNAAVNALLTGQTLTEVVNYTITDADGDPSSAKLTITINGNTDAVDGPTIVPVDGNGAATGQATVVERGLVDGTPGTDTSERTTGSIDITAEDGLTSVVVGGTTVTLAQLQALGTMPVSIDTGEGTLVLTGFTASETVGGVPTAGSLTYTYTLNGQQAQPNATESTDAVSLVVNDAGGGSGTGTLTVRIVDDVPTAVNDAASISEDASPATVTGNVRTGGIGADTLGADDANTVPVSAVAGDPAKIGATVVLAHGSIVINADGSYTYTLDNTNPEVQALIAGETLKDTITYTIKDADGDTSTATLTITIDGAADGGAGDDLPTVTVTDKNGAGTLGQLTVYESGLTSAGDASERDGSSFVVRAADGLAAISINGTTFTLAQLQALGNGNTLSLPDTGKGVLTLTGFVADSTVGSPAGSQVTAGTVSYTYTLTKAQNHAGGDVVDPFRVGVTDRDGDVTPGTPGNLTVLIVDDVPLAAPDTASVTEDGPSTTTGNVFLPNDRIGADGPAAAGPVTGVAFGANAGTVGSSLATAYGAIVLKADGSYTYTLDDNNAAVNALKSGQTLTEVVNYTITDADGDASTTTLTLTIVGRTDAADGPSIVSVDRNGAATGETDVFEHGLVDGPAGPDRSEVGSGTIVVASADGLKSITVGNQTLTLAELGALSPSQPRVITTPNGTLRLTGFTGSDPVGGVPTTGVLSYTYTLDRQVNQPSATQSSESFALSVTDAGGATDTGTLVVRIVDDVPVARADTASVTEDGPTTVAGNLKTNDSVGADDANGVPVTGLSVAGLPVALGSPLALNHGRITVNADGSYVYVLNNDDPAVQALIDGETLTETLSYTLTDADGDSATATLTITIQGRNDGASLSIVDGNGSTGTGSLGQATVDEHGLGDPSDSSETTTGGFVIRTPDGLAGITVGGTPVTPGQLAGLGGKPVVVATGKGTITLTGFDPVTGTVRYEYTLVSRQPHGSAPVMDDIAITVTDRGGSTVSGTLQVLVLDDVPTARDDTASVVTTTANASVAGNVVGGSGRGTGDVPDRIGADATPTPVTGFSIDGRAGTPGGAALAGRHGSLRLSADGSYVYTVNDADPAVAGLALGQTLTEVVNYTITDADGDTASARLIITIRGGKVAEPPVVPGPPLFPTFGDTPPQPLRSDEIFPIVYGTERRSIAQGMEPALFVQLAVRESQQLSRALSAGIATRVAGGDLPTAIGLDTDSLEIGQDMSNIEHVSRDGVAFSKAMLLDIQQSMAARGLPIGLPDGGNALFGDFPGYPTAMDPDAMPAPATPAAPRGTPVSLERIQVPQADGVARAVGAPAEGQDVAGAADAPGANRPVAPPAEAARSFSARLQASAAERGSVSDQVRLRQHHEAVRVRVPAAPV